jgi:UDP-N-acetyl-alpha-D-muramoyl-L-alanyl-L-glutamate epimerase
MTTPFDPASFRTFRFTTRTLHPGGRITLSYALGEHAFTEEFVLPVPAGGIADPQRLDGLLDLLHWCAGVSYFKTAAPPEVAFDGAAPGPAAAILLEALYSEGLGEFAVVNALPALPRPSFGAPPEAQRPPAPAPSEPGRVLVPVGGGKDSVVALEIVRRSGLPFELFSVRDDAAMQRTEAVAQIPRLVATRTLPLAQLKQLGAAGALNGHVPITAIVSCIALLTAAVNGFDAVALANERSASQGNQVYDGIEVNHQFSKSARAEQMLRAAVAETGAGVDLFSILRPASELAIGRAFARLPQYHAAFTSCNRVFRLDPELRSASWCCDCPKCRFVFLILAPYLSPADLTAIFGRPLLDEPGQYEGFALLTATGGHKPFECVGEEEECLAAIELLADDPRWQGPEHVVLRRLIDEALLPRGRDPRRAAAALTLSDEHAVPANLVDDVRALLGA